MACATTTNPLAKAEAVQKIGTATTAGEAALSSSRTSSCNAQGVEEMPLGAEGEMLLSNFRNVLSRLHRAETILDKVAEITQGGYVSVKCKDCKHYVVASSDTRDDFSPGPGPEHHECKPCVNSAWEFTCHASRKCLDCRAEESKEGNKESEAEESEESEDEDEVAAAATPPTKKRKSS